MYTPRAGRIGLAMIATGAAIFGAAPQVVSSAPGHAASRQARSQVELVVSGLEGASGSAVGPGGDLYVTEGAAGRIVRIDRRTGHRTVFASGLPKSIVGIGGVIDVAFRGRTAYALVTLVGPDVGGSDMVGIYRIDGPQSFTRFADIGAFAVANPPRTAFDVPSGLQFAVEPYRNGFLVTDGHHNRVLFVSNKGVVSEFMGFDNIVPTGLSVAGNRIFMTEAGPVPHLPEDGRVVLLDPRRGSSAEVASGAPLLVDVELWRGRHLFALSQGTFPEGAPPAAPALPHTGALLRVAWDGSLDVVADELNLPTSVDFIGDDAYVTTLVGEVWRIALRRHRH